MAEGSAHRARKPRRSSTTIVQRYATTRTPTTCSTSSTPRATTTPCRTSATIRAPLYAVNSADDQVNPPELGILDEAIHKVPRGRYILLPITAETRGHGTHSLPVIWGKYLGELLTASEAKAER